MLESKIQSDTLMAMKNSDKFKVSVLRMLKSAIQAEKINAKNELTDENIIAIIKKQVKQRTDSILEYEKYNRPDMVATLKQEIKILEEYLPKQLSEEETKDREFGAYTGIDDSYTRYVISLDEEDYSRDGIKHINIFDFLMNDDF